MEKKKNVIEMFLKLQIIVEKLKLNIKKVAKLVLATSLVEKKNAFLARILQDFLARSCKLMHFSARHLASILQGEKFPCKSLPRKAFFARFLQDPWHFFSTRDP